MSIMIPPVVIGATGGSGTRVVARIVHGAGVFIGTNRNVSEDAMEFVVFYDRWINRFLCKVEVPFTDAETTAMEAEFRDCIARHRAGIPDETTGWGWKEPRSVYLLPFFHERFPGMKFLHVVRDGRDMAFSANQNQLRKHGEALLDRDDGGLPTPVRAAALWNRINLAAADYGEAAMGPCYLRIRFEELCRDPKGAIATICAFLGCRVMAHPTAIEVTLPDSVGRWRACRDVELVTAIEQHAQPGLMRFGYLP